MPFVSVTDDVALSEPPPVTVQATVAPETALPYWSVTFTMSGADVPPAATTCASPDERTSTEAGPAFPVAVIVVVAPLGMDAVSVLAPAMVPSVQVTVAFPLASVTLDAEPTVPPPLATIHVTVVPDTAVPPEVVT